MAEKKKVPASKMSERRAAKPELPEAKTSDSARLSGAPEAIVLVAASSGASAQLGSFEAAMRLFHARQLKEARELFLQAATGPERDVSHRARLHATMCERRLQQATVSLGSAEDYYNYGVALLNTRNVAEARAHLEKALQIAPGRDHVHYALALALALGGDLESAHENLRRAIELEPRNRLIARQDPDFAPLANRPPFDTLLYPEKKGW